MRDGCIWKEAEGVCLGPCGSVFGERGCLCWREVCVCVCRRQWTVCVCVCVCVCCVFVFADCGGGRERWPRLSLSDQVDRRSLIRAREL